MGHAGAGGAGGGGCWEPHSGREKIRFCTDRVCVAILGAKRHMLGREAPNALGAKRYKGREAPNALGAKLGS